MTGEGMRTVMVKKVVLALIAMAAWGGAGISGYAGEPAQEMEQRVREYFEVCFADLKSVADQYPEEDTFREAMKPVVEKTEGFFGGTLISPDFVIRQVYFKRNFLARGFDLKKVDQLVEFARQMKEKPAPQLSEPARGNIAQPRLVAMRHPVIKDGELVGVVSMMVRTEAFLKAVGLDKVKAFKIICKGVDAEASGTLSENPLKTALDLPSTHWEILFDEGN